MKKTYTLLLLLLVIKFGFTQDIEIYETGTTTDISGTTVYALWEQNPDISKMFTFKNVSNTPKNLIIKRLKLIEVTDGTDYLFWGYHTLLQGASYPSSVVSPFNPWSTPSSFIFNSGEEGILSIIFTPPAEYYGQAHYRYFIEEYNTSPDTTIITLDSIDVIFNHPLSTPEEKPVSFSVYPNPANNVLNINAINIDNASSITIFDISGKTVLTNELTNGKTQLDIKGLNPGIYFYSISNNKDIIETKKLVIV